MGFPSDVQRKYFASHMDRVYLRSSYDEKEEVKALGARYDNQCPREGYGEGMWYVPQERYDDIAHFAKWLPPTHPKSRAAQMYIDTWGQAAWEQQHNAQLAAEAGLAADANSQQAQAITTVVAAAGQLEAQAEALNNLTGSVQGLQKQVCCFTSMTLPFARAI